MDAFEAIEANLGPDALAQGLFLRHRHGLRLALAQGGTRLEQFVQALDRVRVLVDELFGDRPVVRTFVRSFMDDEKGEARVYAQLQELGVHVPADALRRVRWIEPGDSEMPPALEIAMLLAPRGPEVLALLWAVCGADHGVEPSAPVELYLVDLARTVVFHPYDDRGADIVAAGPGPLLPTWRRRYAWTLEFDRPRMTAIFGPPVA